MASNRELKRRIKSASSISKITRAMEAVSGSKMIKSQDRAERGDAYQSLLIQMIMHIKENAALFSDHPLISAPNPSAPDLYIVISSDRGLAGAFNSNLFRILEKRLSDNQPVITLGKKINLYTRKTSWKPVATIESLPDYPDKETILPAATVALEEYLKGAVGSVSLVYQKHISTIQSIPSIEQILPIERTETKDIKEIANKTRIFEPSADVLLEELLEYSISVSLYQAVLSSKAAEQSARMVAMKNASKNAKSLGKNLQQVYNREYQKQITSEISDVVTAKMAIK